jgi:hypothetical protein
VPLVPEVPLVPDIPAIPEEPATPLEPLVAFTNPNCPKVGERGSGSYVTTKGPD